MAAQPIDVSALADPEILEFIRALLTQEAFRHVAGLKDPEILRIGQAWDGIPLAIRWSLSRAQSPAEALAMNLDTLIREANPAFLKRAARCRIAARPRRSRHGSLGRPHAAKRRTVVALAGLTAVAAVAVLVIALLPGSLDGTTPAAAAVLREAATAAADQPPLKLGPGRYLYSKTSSLSYLGEIALTNPVYADPVYLDYKTDSRFWIASNGSAVMVLHNVGPVRFTTPKSRANWVAAGSPPEALSTWAGSSYN